MRHFVTYIPKGLNILLLFLFCVSFSVAQTTYNGICSVGDIPEDMRKTVKELYEEDKGRMEKYTDKRKSRRSKGILECSYAINKMAQSGRILYGDPITLWINEIADTLLKNNRQLRSELRFYTYKSPAVNAFATGQGMIFVSTGLVARLDNEAQMAYVLSHEIVHYVQNHTWESISTKAEETNKRRKSVEQMISKHNRSHRMEVEADSLGLINYYLPSNYYNKIANEVMDILLYSDYASQNIPFDTSYFSTTYYKLPADIWLKTIDTIVADENKADSASTHPNIGKRRALTNRLTAEQNEEGENFLCCTAEEFKDIKYLAQMETIRQLIIAGAYVRAFYESWCLLKTYPDNSYLQRSMAYSIYAMAKHKSESNSNNRIGNYKDYEGEIQQLYYSFGRIKGADLTVLAIRKLYEYQLKYDSSKHWCKITSDAIRTLTNKHNVNLSYFATEPLAQGQKTEDKTDNKPKTKYERIKQAGKVAMDVADIRKYAFTDWIIEDNGFETFFAKSLVDTVEEYFTYNNVLVLSPAYHYYDSDGDFEIKTSERKEEKLSGMVAKMIKQTGKNALEYSGHLLRKQTTDIFYNQYCTVNEWLREIDTYSRILPMTQPDVDNVFTVLEVDHIALVSVSSSAWEGFSRFPILLPYMLYRNVAEKCHTQTKAVVVDRDGRVNIGNTEEVKRNDENGVVKQLLYSCYTDKKNPGYMGKHLLIGASCSGFMGDNINLYDYSNRYFFGMECGLKAEMAVAKQYSLIAAAKQYTTEGYIVNNMEFGFRKYINSAIAPLGPYMQLSIQGRMLSGNTGIESMSKSIVYEGDKALGNISVAPSITLGRTYIYWDNVQLDLFYTFSYAINSIADYENIKGLYIGLGIGINWLAF